MTTAATVEAERLERRRAVRANLGKVTGGLDVAFPDESLKMETPIAALRRGLRRGVVDTSGVITLVQNSEGVLAWREGCGALPLVGRRTPRAEAVELRGDVVTQLRFHKLLPNQVSGFLDTLDRKLTPNQGLRRWDWDNGRFAPVQRPAAAQRALLFVHGTFSNGDNFLKDLEVAEPGLMSWAKRQYDEVLSFDHPTLGVSPVLNAVDLARMFRGARVPVDVVCHSRGGLVVRWWLEGLSDTAAGQPRVVLVGCPLGGTGLASPPRLRGALDFLTNVGHVLETVGEFASAGLPFLTVAVGLMKVVTSITGAAAHTPLNDRAGFSCTGLAG
jgi:hypothetical protein